MMYGKNLKFKNSILVEMLKILFSVQVIDKIVMLVIGLEIEVFIVIEQLKYYFKFIVF